MNFSPIASSETVSDADFCKIQAQQLLKGVEQLCQNLELASESRPTDCFVRAPTEAQVRRVIRARRFRDELFGPALFADPAWDILLELFACELSGARANVTSVCAAAAVPTSTALRWIKNLEERRLVRRQEDPHDLRRWFVSLTPEGSEALASFFDAIVHPPIV